MKNVMIDTSAWIDFFRNSRGTTGDMVADLIRADNAFLTGPIIAELLQGVRGEKENVQLDSLFSTIPCLEVKKNDWINTGKVLQKFRIKGVTIPLTDVLISCVAIRHEMAVLTLDKHFRHLSVDCFGIT